MNLRHKAMRNHAFRILTTEGPLLSEQIITHWHDEKVATTRSRHYRPMERVLTQMLRLDPRFSSVVVMIGSVRKNGRIKRLLWSVI